MKKVFISLITVLIVIGIGCVITYWAFQYEPLASERTLLENAAKSEEPEALRSLAQHLMDFSEEKSDILEAESILKELAESGDNAAIEILALAYFNGEPFGERADLAWELALKAKVESIELLKKVALESHPAYPDNLRADALLRAAEAGIAEAQYLLAMKIGDSEGSENEAYIGWLQEAAIQNYPQALYKYAIHKLGKGEVIEKDSKRFPWLLRAAEAGVLEAEQLVVQTYLSDARIDYTEKDIEKLNERGLQLGLKSAKVNHGKILIINGNTEEGVVFLEDAIRGPEDFAELELLVKIYETEPPAGLLSLRKSQLWMYVARGLLENPKEFFQREHPLSVLQKFEARWLSDQFLHKQGFPISRQINTDLLEIDFLDLSPELSNALHAAVPSHDSIFRIAEDLEALGFPLTFTLPFYQLALESNKPEHVLPYARIVFNFGAFEAARNFILNTHADTLALNKLQLETALELAAKYEARYGPEESKARWEAVALISVAGIDQFREEPLFKDSIYALIKNGKVAHTSTLDRFEEQFLEEVEDSPVDVIYRYADRTYKTERDRGRKGSEVAHRALIMLQEAFEKGATKAIESVIQHHYAIGQSGHPRARELTQVAFEAGLPFGYYYRGFLEIFGRDKMNDPLEIANAIDFIREAAEMGYPRARACFQDLNTEFNPRSESPAYFINNIYQSLSQRDASKLKEILRFERLRFGRFYPGRPLEWVNLMKDIDEAYGWKEMIALYSDPSFPLANDLMVIRAREELAELGDADSQYALGLAYYEGNKVLQDKELALNYLRFAAKQRHPEAQKALASLSAVISEETYDQSDRFITLLRPTQDLTSEVFPVTPYTIDDNLIVRLFDKKGKARKFVSNRVGLDKLEPSVSFLADPHDQFDPSMIRIKSFVHITPYVHGNGFGFYTGLSPRYSLEFIPETDYTDLWVCIVNRSSTKSEQKTLWKRVGRVRSGKNEKLTIKDPLYKNRVTRADVYFFESGREIRSSHRNQPPALFPKSSDNSMPSGTLSAKELGDEYPWSAGGNKFSKGEMGVETNSRGFASRAVFTEPSLNNAAGLKALLGLQGVKFEGDQNPFKESNKADYF